MGQASDTTEEERMVMRECVYEAFWYRSLPLASITGRKDDGMIWD